MLYKSPVVGLHLAKKKFHIWGENSLQKNTVNNVTTLHKPKHRDILKGQHWIYY